MEQQIKLVDVSGAPVREQAFWPTVVLPRAAIEAEIERLASLPRPANGRRAASINHPMNQGPVPAFAPGIDVHIEVLKPGEKTDPVMRNSSRVDMCIRGNGVVTIGQTQFKAGKFDVWNTPSMEPFSYRNESTDLFVRLSYSNAPLLEKLEVHYADLNPGASIKEAAVAGPSDATAAAGPRARDMAKPIPIGSDGAQNRNS